MTPAELLEDLAHDLGRHVRLPLTLLPDGAAATDVREALRRAVFRTRTASGGAQGAAELLAVHVAATPAEQRPTLAGLRAAVARAVDLASQSESDPLPPLSEVRAVVSAIGREIAVLQAACAATGAPR